MSKCYPRIKEYCREKHGLEFQVIFELNVWGDFYHRNLFNNTGISFEDIQPRNFEIIDLTTKSHKSKHKQPWASLWLAIKTDFYVIVWLTFEAIKQSMIMKFSSNSVPFKTFLFPQISLLFKEYQKVYSLTLLNFRL